MRKRERRAFLKEHGKEMFEEVFTNASQMLVQMFWLFLILILVAGLAWSRAEHKTIHD